ncbi:glycosyltransferase [Salinimonas sp. HHU 13199]|uniref:Glycosyltransferase n=1 Tax=Salinimonas profundi TaxID=2729140 RepID=A0ABR8LNY1_9ALTE|nr:glycosyltransferase [Salinimonas profundi]MBD3586631.1 glycosyltransferase [Salinimonas profundi]
MIRKQLKKLKDAMLIRRLQKDKSVLKPGGKLENGRELIVSLTSIASRLHLIDLTIHSLLSQSLQPSKIILWLSETSGELPDNVKQLEKAGLTVRRCEDVGPHTKLVPSLMHYPDAVVVTADDDTLYPKHWLQELVTSYLKVPDAIHCHRAHYIKFDNSGDMQPYIKWGWLAQGHVGPDHCIFPTGVGGVLYPPGSLHQEATNIALFKTLSPKADDIWFKAMALINNTSAVKVRPYFEEYPTTEGSQEDAKLGPQNVGGGGNDKQFQACIEHFNIPLSQFKK